MKRLKYLAIGIFIGALLATAGSALAAPVVQKINAFTHPDYKVVVDGKDVKLENTPITYNDRTYVPLREMGSIIGYEVGFKSGTISLKKDGDKVEETITSEYKSLREIAERDGLTIKNINGRDAVELDQTHIFITPGPRASTNQNEPDIVATPYGSFRIYSNGTENMVNIAEWNIMYAKFKNQ